MLAGVAFDLDGTLVDSIADIGHALNRAFATESLPSFDVTQVRAWVGDGPDGTIQRALEHLGIDDPHGALRRRLRTAYDHAALAAPLDHGRVYPGIVDVLTRLQRLLPLAVITNKPTPLARAVLDAAELTRFFKSVHGADHHAQRKPEPVMLHAASGALGIDTQNLWMVGDSAADLGAAARAGCPAIFVEWGYGRTPPPPTVLRATSAPALLNLLTEP